MGFRWTHLLLLTSAATNYCYFISFTNTDNFFSIDNFSCVQKLSFYLKWNVWVADQTNYTIFWSSFSTSLVQFYWWISMECNSLSTIRFGIKSYAREVCTEWMLIVIGDISKYLFAFGWKCSHNVRVPSVCHNHQWGWLFYRDANDNLTFWKWMVENHRAIICARIVERVKLCMQQ